MEVCEETAVLQAALKLADTIIPKGLANYKANDDKPTRQCFKIISHALSEITVGLTHNLSPEASQEWSSRLLLLLSYKLPQKLDASSVGEPGSGLRVILDNLPLVNARLLIDIVNRFGWRHHLVEIISSMPSSSQHYIIQDLFVNIESTTIKDVALLIDILENFVLDHNSLFYTGDISISPNESNPDHIIQLISMAITLIAKINLKELDSKQKVQILVTLTSLLTNFSSTTGPVMDLDYLEEVQNQIRFSHLSSDKATQVPAMSDHQDLSCAEIEFDPDKVIISAQPCGSVCHKTMECIQNILHDLCKDVNSFESHVLSDVSSLSILSNLDPLLSARTQHYLCLSVHEVIKEKKLMVEADHLLHDIYNKLENKEAEKKKDQKDYENSLPAVIQKINKKSKGYEELFDGLLNTEDAVLFDDSRFLPCLQKHITLFNQPRQFISFLKKIHAGTYTNSKMYQEMKKLLLDAFTVLPSDLQNELLAAVHASPHTCLQLVVVVSDVESELIIVLNQLVHQTDLNMVIGQVAALGLKAPSITLRHLVTAAIHHKGQTDDIVKLLQALPALSVLPSGECDSSLLCSVLIDHLRQHQLTAAQQQNFCQFCHLLLLDNKGSPPILQHQQVLSHIISVSPPFSHTSTLQYLPISLNLNLLLVTIETMASIHSDDSEVLQKCPPAVLTNLLCASLEWCDEQFVRIQGFDAEMGLMDVSQDEVVMDFAEVMLTKKFLLECMPFLVKVVKLKTGISSECQWLLQQVKEFKWTTQLYAALLYQHMSNPPALYVPMCLTGILSQHNTSLLNLQFTLSHNAPNHNVCGVISLYHLVAISPDALTHCLASLCADRLSAHTPATQYSSAVLATCQLYQKGVVWQNVQAAQLTTRLAELKLIQPSDHLQTPMPPESTVCRVLCDSAIMCQQSLQGDMSSELVHICHCLCACVKETCLTRMATAMASMSDMSAACAVVSQLSDIFQCVLHVMSNFHSSTHEILQVLCLDILDLIHQCSASSAQHPQYQTPSPSTGRLQTAQCRALLYCCSQNAHVGEAMKDNMNKKLNNIFEVQM